MFFKGSFSSEKTELLTKDAECTRLISRAETCLTDVINSIEEGTVRVATLNLLKKHSDQFFKLDEIYQTKVERSVGTSSIQDSFSQRLCELEAFLAWKGHVESFIRFSNIFTSGKYINIYSTQCNLND